MILVKFRDGSEGVYPETLIDIFKNWSDIEYIIDFETGEVLV